MAEHRELLESDFSANIYDMAVKEREKNDIIDIDLIMDNLSDKDREILQEIMDNVVIDKKSQEQVFRECIDRWKYEKLSGKERDIIVRLSMADENDNGDIVKQLTDELMRVQKEKNQIQLKLK
ncbi:MAG: hypothetical protein GX671_01665 [Clostridiales bacterium]|nr:hypothetical protein [Clostridiales bacterium]